LPAPAVSHPQRDLTEVDPVQFEAVEEGHGLRLVIACVDD
jgi:hypothetical protein